MRSKADRFYARHLRDEPPFERWRFWELEARRPAWRARASTAYVSVTSLESRLAAAEVHSGVSPRPRRKSNKRARARRVVFWMILPPFRNYGVRDVKRELAAPRGAVDKCEVGLAYATRRHIGYRVTEDVARALRARGVSVPQRFVVAP
jgi:hypothetical protein